MKGRTLEELDEIFAARVPARKFPEYQCVIKEQVVQTVKAQEMEAGIDDKPASKFMEN